jgi:uncharacterized protein
VTVSTHQPNLPDYEQLVKFLFQPFLSAADAMTIDCEYTVDRHRVWIRVAVASNDQGSAFGRGGRNIQAIRTVVQAAATAVGQSIHLDVYGSNSGSRHLDSDLSTGGASAPTENRSSGIKPTRRSPNGGDRPNEIDAPDEKLRQRSSLPPPRPRR